MSERNELCNARISFETGTNGGGSGPVMVVVLVFYVQSIKKPFIKVEDTPVRSMINLLETHEVDHHIYRGSIKSAMDTN
eukprot:1426754-Ditylum_brightwellii.AAC.1